jgi:hypothetical protein
VPKAGLPRTVMADGAGGVSIYPFTVSIEVKNGM